MQKENGRTKVVRTDPAVITHWRSTQKETKCANSNQKDLDQTFKQLVCPNGVDEKLYNKNLNYLDAVIQTDKDWKL